MGLLVPDKNDSKKRKNKKVSSKDLSLRFLDFIDKLPKDLVHAGTTQSLRIFYAPNTQK